jgi:hypothetical protein
MAAVITSITGLQNLPNLTNFNAEGNGLQSVNLSGLTNLRFVDISDNNIPGSGTNSLTSVNLSGSTAIEELYLDDSDFSAFIPNLSGLTSLLYFDMYQCSITGNVDVSILPALTGFDLGGNTGLTSVTIFEQVLNSVNLSNTALTEASVNDILQWLDGGGEENGYVDLSDGTSATPTGTGLTAYNNLIGKGWDVNVNGITTTTTTTTTIPVFSFSVRRNNTGPCASSPVTTIYSDSTTLGPGINVYNDINLTSPISPLVHICDCINNIDYTVLVDNTLSSGVPTTCI